MKRRAIWIVPATICLLAVLFLAWQTSNTIRIDGLSGTLLGLFLPTDTKYADGYSHAGFVQVRVGMSEQEVLDILGEPLTRWTPYAYTNFPEKRHFVGLQYSISPTSTHYRLRQVYLDSGVVAERIGYFYVD